MTVEVDRKAHIRANYDVSALPFDHPEAKNFTVHIRCRPDGKYVIQDMFAFYVTDEIKHDPRSLVLGNRDYFEKHCLMVEEQAFEVAVEFVERMLVNGLTAADIRKRDALTKQGENQEAVRAFMGKVARANRENKVYEDTTLSEEEFRRETQGEQ